jgi:spore coat protein H
MTRSVALTLGLCLLAACNGEPPGGDPDESDKVFDPAVLHQVEITVAPENLPQLTPGNEERISADVVFDGIEAKNIGIKLKGFIGSVQDLNGKPGFSIKLDEFVQGQEIFGVRKFTLDNSIQDPSFVSQHVGYEIWRRAGVPAPRTAFARVNFNGEYFGVYLVHESQNKDFLERNHADPDGNLYEGVFGVDVVDIVELDLETNEEQNDRADVEALADIILNTPDDQLVAAVEAKVDVDEFLRFWAVEVLTYHWDGYAQFGTFGCCSPNNYYIYHDPTRDKFVFSPHGADQLFQDVSVNVTNPPSPGASLATRLFVHPEIQQRLAAAIRGALSEAWDVAELTERIDAAEALISPSVAEFDRFRGQGFVPNTGFVRSFLVQRPQIAIDQLIGAGF